MAQNILHGIQTSASLAEAQRAVDEVLGVIWGNEAEVSRACLGHYDAVLVPLGQAKIAVKIHQVMLYLYDGPDFCQVHQLYDNQAFIVHFREVETQGHSVVNAADKVEFFPYGEGTSSVRTFVFDGFGQAVERLL